MARTRSELSNRAVLVAQTLPGLADWIPELIVLAQHGLAQMHTDDGKAVVQTARGIRTPQGSVLRPEGDNLRYAAIAALGLVLLPLEDQRSVLSGSTAENLAAATAKRAHGHREPGAVALSAWAAAEVLGNYESGLFEQLSAFLDTGEPLPTVDIAWMVTAGLAARRIGETSGLVDDAVDRIMAAQGPGGLFPHMLPAGAAGRFRAHIGSFADQVYPIQALARFAAVTGSTGALSAANRCAASICDLQGAAGQWWWHYDSRKRQVVEGYPVYSVHQHAMAPMVLFDLAEAGGDDHLSKVALGLDWLRTHPEVMDELVSPAHGVVWRKVGRREPPKAVRSLSAVTTSVRPGLHLPALDTVFPPEQIDYECRPYELGWLLYAWLSGGGAPPSSPE